MIINHNMSSINTSNFLKFKTVDVRKEMEKLSSGMKINRAGDDASNLAVSEKLRSQIRGLQQAEKNIQNGVSFIQTTGGYLNETGDILQRMRELAVQSANGIYSVEDRGQIAVEVKQLVDEIDRVASHAQFNGMNMLQGQFASAQTGGTPTNSMWFQVGANMDQRKQVFIGDMTAKALKVDTTSISTPDSSNQAIGAVDQALLAVNKQRADLGAYQNRFEIAQKGVSTAWENMQAAESIIRDTNMASEMVNFVKDNILQQSGTAMLAQANTQAQTVLRLLG
jgi:flagellin